MPDVTVVYRDEALAALVVQAAREVEGVVRLQQRPVSAVTRRLVALARQPTRPHLADASAVDLERDPDGVLDVSVRLVSRLDPAPRTTITAVADAVRGALAVAGETPGRVEVTVTDVRT